MILLTGGLGYIGSHTAVELCEAGYDVVIIDNLSNSKIETLDKLEQITGSPIKFYKGDVQDKELLRRIFTENDISAVMHFAGYKAVGESVEKPLDYYDNNNSTTSSYARVWLQKFCV